MDRDALTAEVAEVIQRTSPKCDPEEWEYNLATAVLDHLHPVIETAEELDALPAKVVLMDADEQLWRLSARRSKADNLETNGDHLYSRSSIKLPATILHRGQP